MKWGVEHSPEWITVCHLRNGKLFKWIEYSVAVKGLCKQKKSDTYALTPFACVKFANGCVVRYPTGVKSAGFQTRLEAFLMLSHTDELLYNETVCLSVDDSMYVIHNGPIILHI